ncbi:hypothetical protein D3C86_1755230 [compost metagenome]
MPGSCRLMSSRILSLEATLVCCSNCLRSCSCGMRARTASTKSALCISSLSFTMATMMPYWCLRSWMETARGESTVLSAWRRASITGSKLTC